MKTRVISLVVLAAVLSPGVPGSERVSLEEKRIVAIGDIHGALEPLLEILRETNLIDRSNRWIGGATTLVQTGDFLDRGDQVIEVARLLMRLQAEAHRAGGRVVVLLGNHETENLTADRRHVSAGSYAFFADSRSPKRRADECRAWARMIVPFSDEKLRDLRRRCERILHLGEVEYVAALDVGTELGRWLRQLPPMVKIDDIVFVHGGITEEIAVLGLAETHRRARAEISAIDTARSEFFASGAAILTTKLPHLVATLREIDPSKLSSAMKALLEFDEWLLVRKEGPFWFRGYARWSEEEGRSRMPGILRSLGARAVVAAHTPQISKSIIPRFDSRVFLIDTGMLASVYRGRPSALEIEGDRFSAVYIGERRTLPAAPPKAQPLEARH